MWGPGRAVRRGRGRWPRGGRAGRRLLLGRVERRGLGGGRRDPAEAFGPRGSVRPPHGEEVLARSLDEGPGTSVRDGGNRGVLRAAWSVLCVGW